MIDYISNMTGKKLIPYVSYLVLIILVILFPRLVSDNYMLHLVIVSLTYGAMVTNWNLNLGYGGVFHIAQPTFFAIGLYSAAISTVRFGISPWLGLIIGGIASFIASIFIGIPALRVKGSYLILLTFAFHFSVSELVFHLSDYTGGCMGLVVPTFTLGTIRFSPLYLDAYYYIAVIILILSIFTNWAIMRTPMGKSLIAIRDSEVLASSVGISIFKSKMNFFAISAFLTGIAGAFFAYYTLVVSPEQLSFHQITNGFGMILIGGIGTLFGPALGSFILTFVSELFRGVEAFRPIIVGLVIIFMLLFAPYGIIHGIKKLVDWVGEEILFRKKHNTFNT